MHGTALREGVWPWYYVVPMHGTAKSCVKLSPWYYVVPMYGTALREGVTLVLCGSYAWDGFT